MIADLLLSTIQQYLGPTKTSPKGWKTRNCMLCHLSGETRDTRGRFGIKFDSGNIGVHCFNCGFETGWRVGEELSHRFRTFLRELGIPQHDIQQLAFQAYKEKHELNKPTTIQLKGQLQDNWTESQLPESALSITQWLEAGCTENMLVKSAKYAVERKFHNLDDLYWTPETEPSLNRRIILPFRYNNKIVGYTARWIGKTPNKSVPKYLNHMPDNYIYNLDNQINSRRQYVILIEGVFDARTVDGISPINNTLSREQIEIINRLNREVIVCPDKDKDGRDFVKTALEQNWAVSYPDWDESIKDASEAAEQYGRILTTQSIIESAEHNKMKIELKWRLGKSGRNRRLQQGD